MPPDGPPGAYPGRVEHRWNLRRLLALIGAAVITVVGAVAFSGAALPVVLRDPGAVVRWGLPLSQTLVELASALTIGSLVLAVCVLPRRALLPVAELVLLSRPRGPVVRGLARVARGAVAAVRRLTGARS